MRFNHTLRASQGDCPRGSSYFRCGGGQTVTWSGCCSTEGCNSGGCPVDAEINISIAPGAPWPTFSSDTPKVTSDVGAPVTAAASSLTTVTTPAVIIDTTASSSTTVTTPTVIIDTTALHTDYHTPTSAITIDESTGAPTAVATTSGVGSQPSEVAAEGLPQTAIAGISVGSTIALLGVSLVIFLLIRRRKHARRMPSYRENFRDNCNDKPMGKNNQATDGYDAADVFAPFGGNLCFFSLSDTTIPTICPIHTGINAQADPSASLLGRANSFESHKPPKSVTPSAGLSTKFHHDGPSTVSNPSSPAGSSFANLISPQSTGVPLLRESGRCKDIIAEEKPDAPAQLDSEGPLHFELDSADTEKSNMAELPVPSPPNTTTGLCHEPDSDHPESMMPGSFPIPVHAAQTQKLTRVQSGDASVVTVRNKGQLSRPGSYEHPARLRATMNATEDDVKSNRHVNSWDHL